MKKLIIAMLICSCTVGAYAQTSIADTDKAERIRQEIGIDTTMPDFETKKIDEKVMGTRLANLLNYWEESYGQGTYARKISLVLSEQKEEFKNYAPEVKKIKLQKVSKAGNEILIVYKVWLNSNPSNIKQTEAVFHFTDGVSDSKTVNELFSYMSRYVQAREQMNN